jgi:hypothetical protein
MMTTHQFTVRASRLLVPFMLIGLATSSGPSASAQALPAAEAAPISTGFALPTSLGSLQYAVTASQSLSWGYYSNSGPSVSANISGDLAYLSHSERHPFSMVFSAGHSFSEGSGPTYNFVSLGFSQVANVGKWNFVLSDNFSYLPGTAASGLSGVPGNGDLGVNPIQIGGDSAQGVLTNFSNRVSNTIGGSVSRQLTGKTSLNAGGSYSTTRFLDNTLTSSNSSGAGLDNDSVSGQGGINHQLDARTSFGGSYAYSTYSYSGNNFGIAEPGFYSQTASGVYSHSFSRKLSINLSAGPQWTTIQTSTSSRSTSLFVDASAAYTGKSANSTLTFVRSTNNGYGALGGSLSNGVSFTFSRKLGVVWNLSATSSYTRSSNLLAIGIGSFSSDTYVESAQISRAIVRSLSGFLSYTIENQSTSGGGAIDVYSGTSQTLGFGITYSPSALHLGRP